MRFRPHALPSAQPVVQLGARACGTAAVTAVPWDTSCVLCFLGIPGELTLSGFSEDFPRMLLRAVACQSSVPFCYSRMRFGAHLALPCHTCESFLPPHSCVELCNLEAVHFAGAWVPCRCWFLHAGGGVLHLLACRSGSCPQDLLLPLDILWPTAPCRAALSHLFNFWAGRSGTQPKSDKEAFHSAGAGLLLLPFHGSGKTQGRWWSSAANLKFSSSQTTPALTVWRSAGALCLLITWQMAAVSDGSDSVSWMDVYSHWGGRQQLLSPAVMAPWVLWRGDMETAV